MGTEDAIVLLYYTNMCVFELMCVASGVLSSILRVSRSTICRRMGQYGLSYSRNYCCVSDADLDDNIIVKRISMQHPGCGSKMMEGHLLSKVKAGSHCSSPRPRDYSRGMHAHTRIARINTCMYISAWIPRARDN